MATHTPHDGTGRGDADVIVVGAGVIGLAIAWRLLRDGRQVLVCDPAPAGGATHAAAGMLGATAEFHHTESGLASVLRTAAARYPAFLADLPDTTGYESAPTLRVGLGADDRQTLEDLAAATPAGAMERISLQQARRDEPFLASSLSCAYRAPDDHRVDPRALAATLLRALQERTNVSFVAHAVSGVLRTGDRVRGVRLRDGSEHRAQEVVITCGAGVGAVEGVPHAGLVRPVFGEVLRLGVPEQLRPVLTATIRALVHGRPVYLLPRGATAVVGATARETGGAGTPVGGVRDLLNDATEVLPTVAELELLEVTTRARPGTPDNAPLVGRVEPGLVLATGTYRNGVLLAPLVADLCAGLLADPTAELTEAELEALSVMDPTRFERTP